MILLLHFFCFLFFSEFDIERTEIGLARAVFFLVSGTWYKIKSKVTRESEVCSISYVDTDRSSMPLPIWQYIDISGQRSHLYDLYDLQYSSSCGVCLVGAK